MLQAWKYTLPAFVVPFMFTVHPAGLGLLLETKVWTDVAKVTLTAVIGLAALAAGASGWLLRRTTWLERALLVGAGLLLVYPDTRLDLVAAAVVGTVIILQVMKRLPAEAASSGGG